VLAVLLIAFFVIGLSCDHVLGYEVVVGLMFSKWQGSHGGYTKKKDFEKEFFKKKEGNLRKRRKRRISPNVQSYEGKNRLSRGEIGRAWTELHFRFSFCTQ
jgi:hypothetical protein